MVYWIVEKKNHKALHGIFDSYERAVNHLNNTIPFYCDNGYFMDKTLTPDSFEIIEKNIDSYRNKSRIVLEKIESSLEEL